jgi:hypothetical protein
MDTNKNYKIKTKVHTHNPKTVDKLIGGGGILKMLGDMIGNIGRTNIPNPFDVLEEDDFGSDPIAQQFLNMGGPKHVVKVFRIDSPDQAEEAMRHMASVLNQTKLAEMRKGLRSIFASLQSTLEIDNQAVQMERIASKMPRKSPGYWQAESLSQIDSLKRIANREEYSILDSTEKMVNSGGYVYIAKAAQTIKSMYESISTPRNTRVAYTTLGTTDGEPILMCPKGIVEYGGAVPMEASKCRWNCVDSRMDKDGNVRCNYETWMKQSFQSHDVVMGNLDVTRHPDNEANLLNIKDGERKTHEDQIGYEKMFEDSKLKSSKRDSSNTEESREKQLDELKPSLYGHSVDDKKLNKRTSQSDHFKTVENQLPNREEVKKSLFDRLIEKYNNKTDSEEVIEENLANNAGLYDQKGDMKDSIAHQTNAKESKPVHVSEEINKDAGDGDEDTVSGHLNKTAKKKMNLESFDSHLEEKRTNEDIDKTIEELLAEDTEDWGHQFTDEDIKMFESELGLDHILSESREK